MFIIYIYNNHISIGLGFKVVLDSLSYSVARNFGQTLACLLVKL